MLNILLKLQQHNIISSGDYYFAELIAEKQHPFNYPEPIQQLAVLLAALANYSYQQGNTCLYLDHNRVNRATSAANPCNNRFVQSVRDFYREAVYLFD